MYIRQIICYYGFVFRSKLNRYEYKYKHPKGSLAIIILQL